MQPPPDDNNVFLTYLALVLSIGFWGFSFVATKIALQSFPPLCLIFFRFGAASVFFLVLLACTGFPTLNRKNLKSLALLALFQPGLYFLCETVGLQYTTATKTSLIIATIPLVVLTLSSIFLKERIRAAHLIGISISLVGVALLIYGSPDSGDTDGMLLGDLLIGGAVLSAAVYMIIARSLGQSITPVQITGMQAIFGGLIFLPMFLYDLPNLNWAEVTPQAVAALVMLTLFATSSSAMRPARNQPASSCERKPW